MRRYRAARRRRARLALGIALALAAVAYAWFGPRSAPPPKPAPAPPEAAAPAPSAAPPTVAAAPAPPPPPPDPSRLELEAAWQAAALPAPPRGWLAAYAEVVSAACARLELVGSAEALTARVTAPDPDAASRVMAAAREVAGVVAVEAERVAGGGPLCGLIDLVNRVTLPSPAILARLEAPRDRRCPAPPCYAGLPQRRLREGERLALSVVSPPVASEIAVVLLGADGMVTALYPNPAAGLGPSTLPAGEAIWIGDARAGAGFVERKVAPPFGQAAVLVLAAPAPLFQGGQPASEPLPAFLERLRRALRAQAEATRPLASLLVFETAPAVP